MLFCLVKIFPLFIPQKWEVRASYQYVFYSIKLTPTELKLNLRKALILIILCLYLVKDSGILWEGEAYLKTSAGLAQVFLGYTRF